MSKIRAKNVNRNYSCKLFLSPWFDWSNIFKNNFLSYFEINRAKLTWIYIVQNAYFQYEIHILNLGHSIKKSSLLKLDPFLDDGLLRLGGRIHNSLLSYDQKHPLILPFDCQFSKLLAIRYHLKTIHGGVRLTLSTLRQESWIIKCRILVRNCIHKCHDCIRYRADPSNQKMGILPAFRVQKPHKPFHISGVDYAGPYNILRYRGRGAKTYMGYICIFVCMATKAVHIELVTGYSSNDFILAFRRFTSVRGPCSGLVSDQGTSCVGADKILKELYMASSSYVHEISGLLANEGTNWSFNTPAAPHFGGIWEAAVKSVKHHIRRVIHDHTFTFEVMYTLLKQVEACLNSRPIIPLADDPDNHQLLSPSFLLTQSNSYLIPEQNYLDAKIPPFDRYKQIQLLLQGWWKAWSNEYLQTLQERCKWRQAKRNIIINDIVLISDEILPPSKWPLGIVIKIGEGSDDLVRSVEIRTSSTTLRRPIHKLILLEPNENNKLLC